jgi:hypothetical protein
LCNTCHPLFRKCPYPLGYQGRRRCSAPSPQASLGPSARARFGVGRRTCSMLGLDWLGSGLGSGSGLGRDGLNNLKRFNFITRPAFYSLHNLKFVYNQAFLFIPSYLYLPIYVCLFIPAYLYLWLMIGSTQSVAFTRTLLLSLDTPGTEAMTSWWPVAVMTYSLACSLWIVVGGWWLVVGGWWLVVGGWWLVVGGDTRSNRKVIRSRKKPSRYTLQSQTCPVVSAG